MAKWKIKDEEFELVGVQHRITPSTRRYIRQWVEDNGAMIVEFKREPKNVHDENAIAVYAGPENPYRGTKLGYLRRQVAEVLAPKIDKGKIELGTSVLAELDEERGVGNLQVKLRIAKAA